MKKFLSLSLIIFASVLPVFSVTLEDMELQGPKPPDKPENPYVEVKQNIEKKEVKTDIEHVDPGDLTYADLSIKKMSQEISKELELEEDDMMGDLSLLWQGAASKSDTISFALYKLANPDENKPDEKSVKKVLMNIASMSTLVGAGMGLSLIHISEPTRH